MSRLLLSLASFTIAIGVTNRSVYEGLAIAFSLDTFLLFARRFGQQIVLLECMSCIATLEILLVPALTYWILPLSMPIESDVYFSYALPACLLFCLGLSGIGGKPFELSHKTVFKRAATYLHNHQDAIIPLFIIGLAGFLLKLINPDIPSFLGTLPMYCLLVGALYAYYARYRYRMVLINSTVAVLLINTIRTGMFGDLFFWILLLVVFGLVHADKPLTNWVKAMTIGMALAFLLIIQSIKGEYRYRTWGYQRTERYSDPALMYELFADRILHPEKILNTSRLVLSMARFNQGVMIGSAMDKVPDFEAYAHGEVLLSLLYPLVPRLLWTDKPTTGGYENIRRFTTLPQFTNTSINLSPIGEGYVNFGYGGILFSGLYGALLGGCYRLVFRIAETFPSVVLWLPMLFMGCLTMETDLLSTWGSLANSAVFVIVLYNCMRLINIKI